MEAGGQSLQLGQHAARFAGGRPGIFQGMKTFLLQDKTGQIANTHSISAGLDYAGIGPEHSYLHDCGRVEYDHVNDDEAVLAFHVLAKYEGIIPALESSHALAYIAKTAANYNSENIVIVNLSGRGDKDIGIIQGYKK